MDLFNKGDIIKRTTSKFGTVSPGDRVEVVSCRGTSLTIKDDDQYTYDAAHFKKVLPNPDVIEGSILRCTVGNARFQRNKQYEVIRVTNNHPQILIKSVEEPEVIWWISDNLKDEDDLISHFTKVGIAEFELVATEEESEVNIGQAVEHAKAGNKFTRKGWNGADQFVYYVPAASYPAQRNANNAMSGIFANDMVPYNHYLAIKTAQGTVSPWSPSGSDALATDFILL